MKEFFKLYEIVASGLKRNFNCEILYGDSLAAKTGLSEFKQKYNFIMKNLILFNVFFSAIQINAQWYTRQFNVTDINQLSETQLNKGLHRANNMTVAGKVLTVVGIPAIFSGSLILRQSRQADIFNSSLFTGEHLEQIGLGVITGGVVLIGIGVPLSFTGNSRKKILNARISGFYGTSYIPSVGIIINF